MPEIPQYDASEGNVPHPNQAGYEAHIMAGRREGQLAHEIGTEIGQGIAHLGGGAVDFAEQRDNAVAHHEIAQNAPRRFQMELEDSETINNIVRNAKPGEDVMGAIQAHLNARQDDYQQFVDSFNSISGKEWARKVVGQMGENAGRQASAAIIESQSQRTMDSIEQMTNFAAVRAAKYPAESGVAIDQLGQDIDHILKTMPLTPEAQARFEKVTMAAKQHVAYSTVLGVIEQNPEAGAALARQFAEKGLLTPEQLEQSGTRVTVRNKQMVDESWENKHRADELARDNLHKGLSDAYAAMIQPDGSLMVSPNFAKTAATIKDLADKAHESGAEIAFTRANRAIIEEQQEGKFVKTSPQLWQGLNYQVSQLATSPAFDPEAAMEFQSRLSNLKADHQISNDDYARFTRMLSSANQSGSMSVFQTQASLYQFLQGQKSLFSGSDALHVDEMGDALFQSYGREMQNKFDIGLASGKTSQELLDPKSKSFIGRAPGLPDPIQQIQQAYKPPVPGEVREGFRFKGGDDKKKENWEPVK